MSRKPLRPATQRDATQFVEIAFRDYVAARHLLLHEFPFQGAQLASTAVEKYIKSLIAMTGSLMPLHFDQLTRFKNEVASRKIDVLDNVDPRFLQLLSTAFRLRYYDSVTDQSPFGFLTLQFLAELDGFVNALESRLTLSIGGMPGKTSYQRAVEARDPLVWNENYVLNGIPKKDFMERFSGSLGFSFLLDGNDLVVTSKANSIRVQQYEGRMATMPRPMTVTNSDNASVEPPQPSDSAEWSQQ